MKTKLDAPMIIPIIIIYIIFVISAYIIQPLLLFLEEALESQKLKIKNQKLPSIPPIYIYTSTKLT